VILGVDEYQPDTGTVADADATGFIVSIFVTL